MAVQSGGVSPYPKNSMDPDDMVFEGAALYRFADALISKTLEYALSDLDIRDEEFEEISHATKQHLGLL